VPKGDFCYKIKKIAYTGGGKRVIVTKNCPYWCWDEKYPGGRVGHCNLLKVGDMDDDCSGLLFDQIKECGLNEYE
jgi:hypothetical protein